MEKNKKNTLYIIFLSMGIVIAAVSFAAASQDNLALEAAASASSEYSYAYRASNAIDGIKGIWDQGEWACYGAGDRNPSLRLNWTSVKTANKIVIYGRPNKFDGIQNAKITLSTGYTMTIGEIPSGGAAKEIYFPSAQITWLEFKVLDTSAMNPGITEIEVYNESSANSSNTAPQANASASSEYSSGYRASNAIDGIKGIWDQGEWACYGAGDRNPSLRLTWTTTKTANKIVIYGRPNKFDGIQNAKITLSTGYNMTIGEIPSGGAAKEIYFPSAQITWLEFKVLDTSAMNPGITEIEVYNESSANSSNTATQAAASASSEYSSGYRASNAIDGIKGIWDQGEWACHGAGDRNPSLRLTWTTAKTANKIVIYGRPNKFDGIQNARITLSTGYTMTIGEIPSGGAAKEIYFPSAQITWLEFKVLETNAMNPGITEIEVYNTDSPESTPSDDSDSDSVYDIFDKFPDNNLEYEDTDDDGTGNNYDTDDDNDGVGDGDDKYPYNSSKTHTKHDFLICASMPTTWDYENAWESLINNIDVIDILNTCWYTMNEDGTITCDEENASLITLLIKLAHNRNLQIIPYINNYNSQTGLFDPERVSTVINNDTLTVTHIQNIVNETVEKGYDGINIDYESCYAEDRDAFKNFIKNLASALHNHGKILEVSLHAKTEEPGTWDGPQSQDWQAISDCADFMRIMTYDYSWSTSPPGPIAPVDWISDVTDFALTLIPKEKLIMGIPFYGYDWVGNNAADKTYEEVQEIINDYGITPNWNSTAKEPYFTYGNHTVYYENSESISYKLDIFYASNVKGISIWRLGGEDPENWDIIKNILPDPTPTTLLVMCLGDSITHGHPYYLEPEKTYPVKLEGLLDTEYGTDNCQVINYGVSGFRADQVLSTMQALNLLDIDPDVVLLKIGGNDLSQETLPDKSNFFQVVNQTVSEVQAIINLVKAHTNTDGTHPKIIVSTFIPIQDYWSTIGLKIYNNTLISSLTGMDSLITTNWNDFYNPSTKQAYSNLMSDSCHPNEAGYSIMAENWLEAIQGLDYL